MKKLFFLAAFAVLSTMTIQAQQFKAGIAPALPIGDAGDVASFGVNADLMYLFEVSEGIQVGPMAGVAHYFGKSETIDLGPLGSTEVEFDDVTFLPLGVTGRINLSDEFVLGADLGYALGLSDGIDGGFHYRPRAGYMLSEQATIMLAYSGISLDGGTWNALSIGVEFGF